MKSTVMLSLFLLVLLLHEIDAGYNSVQRTRKGCLLTGKKRYDRCNRRCDVARGRLVNCCRVRKDFESMDRTEQRRFIRAYLTVSTNARYRKEYVKLITMHQKNFFTRIHRKEEFLPWHRWFILKLENLLRKVDCRVTVPYWDWSIWSHDPWDRRNMWSAYNGLGGNGRKGDECVTTGPFRVGKWKTATGDCLRRNFNSNPPDADQVEITIREANFSKFDVMLRVNLHEGMHCFINGTMCSGKSAEAPEFFFHHGFIDKIWSDFQKKGPSHKWAYFPSIKKKMVAIPFFPKDLIDNKNLPYGVKVCYDDPTTHSARKIRKFLHALSFQELETLERLAFGRTPRSAMNLFHLSSSDRKKAKLWENEAMQHVDSKRKSSIFAKTLSSLERVEGFVIPDYCEGGRTYY